MGLTSLGRAPVRLIRQVFAAGLGSPFLATLVPAVDAHDIDVELSRRLLVEHVRLESKVAGLQATGRSVAALIALVDDTDRLDHAPCRPRSTRRQATGAAWWGSLRAGIHVV